MEHNKSLAIFLLNVLLWFKFGVPCWLLLIGTFTLVYFLNKEDFQNFFSTLPRDIKATFLLARVRRDMARRLKENIPIADIFARDIVPKYRRKPAFIDIEKDGEIWTFAEADAFSNQIANYFHGTGLVKENDKIALFMTNCPEYGCTWLGLSRIGVVSALINFNLRLEPLGHSIRVADAKLIIVSSDLQGALEDAINEGFVSADIPIFVYGAADNGIHRGRNMGEELKEASKLPPTVKINTSFKSVLFYIYTSGTTGLPKAAVINHARYYFMSYGLHQSFDMTPNDRVYVCMPCYHSAAGILGVGQVFLAGCSIAVRKKFSASNFWKECVRYECTAAQYIGEICRYLLATPFNEAEKNHIVRLMYGNGLRPQIWEQFTKRFGIAKIGEFYGSTEGNTSILNIDNKTGACGFFPVYGGGVVRRIYPLVLAKIDEASGELVRDSQGLCVPIKPGESGEIIGKIVRGDPLKDFSGYVNQKDTEKKLVKNVTRPGDVAFSSGDILYMDHQGYLYFKDRTGDTFRWKGENVSTGEVEAIISNIVGLSDATVYGVEIPGNEGKAGMAAIVDPNENCDLKELLAKMKSNLPPYARPVFIRICKEVDTTGTYKLKKADMRKAGFDLEKCKGDSLYYLSGKSGQYEKITEEVLKDIESGKIKF